LEGSGVATEFAAQERPGPKEKMEGMAVGVVNVEGGRDVEYVVKAKG
jgi:hypothetical protein